MGELDEFDPALFGVWANRAAYGGGMPEDDEMAEAARAVLLEVKSAEEPPPGEQLRQLMNEMTVEMRQQFKAFREMREHAAAALQGGDETEQKLARADMKAATDAMSLIVRTLEKIDSLQRQLARDRDVEAERAADAGGYDKAKAQVIKLIEDRAHDRAQRLFEAWKQHGAPPALLQRDGLQRAEPAEHSPEGHEDRG